MPAAEFVGKQDGLPSEAAWTGQKAAFAKASAPTILLGFAAKDGAAGEKRTHDLSLGKGRVSWKRILVSSWRKHEIEMRHCDNFENEVIQQFSLLEDYGFSLSRSVSTLVCFSSPLYFLNIFYGRRSYELGLEVQAANEANAPRFTFDVLVAVFDEEAAHAMQPFGPLEHPEDVRKDVARLAIEFRKYIPSGAFAASDLSARMASAWRRMSNKRYPTTSVPIKERFLSLWNGGHYSELVTLFGPIQDDLSADDRLIIAEAKKRIENK